LLPTRPWQTSGGYEHLVIEREVGGWQVVADLLIAVQILRR